jgi:hypothetical protein
LNWYRVTFDGDDFLLDLSKVVYFGVAEREVRAYVNSRDFIVMYSSQEVEFPQDCKNFLDSLESKAKLGFI